MISPLAKLVTETIIAIGTGLETTGQHGQISWHNNMGKTSRGFFLNSSYRVFQRKFAEISHFLLLKDPLQNSFKKNSLTEFSSSRICILLLISIARNRMFCAQQLNK